MFAPLSRYYFRHQQSSVQEPQRLTVQDSGLTEQQLEDGEGKLQLLGLHDCLDALYRDECVDFLFAVGLNPTLDLFEAKLRQLRLHRQETFTWGELAHVWKLLLGECVDEDEVLAAAFDFFDQDGNREISVAELTATMRELGDLLSAEEIAAFVALMDKNADGVIGYEEFIQTLHSELPGRQACSQAGATLTAP